MKKVSRAKKAGGSPNEAKQKRRIFARAFMANGGNATEAAKSAGYSARSAKQAGSRLLSHVDVQAQLATQREEVLTKWELGRDKVLKNLAQELFYDPRRFFNPDGTLKAMHELDEDTVMGLAGFEVVESIGLEGEGFVPRYTKKIRLVTRSTAREQAMKHKGLFAQDNEQKNVERRFIYVPGKGPNATQPAPAKT